MTEKELQTLYDILIKNARNFVDGDIFDETDFVFIEHIIRTSFQELKEIA